jgi:hypothetical protein
MIPFDRERAAKILCDAAIVGDLAASLKWGAAKRSIRHYRHKLKTDEKLRRLTREMMDKQNNAWANQVPVVLSTAMGYLEQAFLCGIETGAEDSERIKALTSAMSALADIELTRQALAQKAMGIVPDEPQDA